MKKPLKEELFIGFVSINEQEIDERMEVLMRLLGQSSLNTTEIYTDVANNAIKSIEVH